MITEKQILEIVISYGEPTTEFTSLILSTDYNDMVKEIFEAVKKNKYGIDLI